MALLPLTDPTRGLIDRTFLAKLAQDGPLGGPVLINAGRGKPHCGRDIVAALDDGTLAAATFDVLEEEPLPRASPLWSRPKVTVTPHIAGVSSPSALTARIAAGIRDFETGRTLANIVDRGRGY